MDRLRRGPIGRTIDAPPNESQNVISRLRDTRLFETTTTRDGGTTTVALSGELDLSSSHSLARDLLAVEQHEPGRLVVDLAGLTFIDARGMRVLLEAGRRVERRGGRLVLSEPRSDVRRVMELVGLDQVATLGISPR
ncbi:MAG: STAS domain-containing protein [Gaiellaceae bacterium]